jgi:hypothetical protein
MPRTIFVLLCIDDDYYYYSKNLDCAANIIAIHGMFISRHNPAMVAGGICYVLHMFVLHKGTYLGGGGVLQEIHHNPNPTPCLVSCVFAAAFL